MKPNLKSCFVALLASVFVTGSAFAAGLELVFDVELLDVK